MCDKSLLGECLLEIPLYQFASLEDKIRSLVHRIRRWRYPLGKELKVSLSITSINSAQEIKLMRIGVRIIT